MECALDWGQETERLDPEDEEGPFPQEAALELTTEGNTEGGSRGIQKWATEKDMGVGGGVSGKDSHSIPRAGGRSWIKQIR